MGEGERASELGSEREHAYVSSWRYSAFGEERREREGDPASERARECIIMSSGVCVVE